MFKTTTSQSGRAVHLSFEGEVIAAFDGDNVAAALLRVGKLQFRTAAKNDGRGHYCMMGVCFQCLVEIDGKPNQQACQIIIRDGMQIRRQQAPNITSEL